VASKRERQVRETVTLVALDRVLAIVRLLSTNLLVPADC
jgi:hypothetical protein